MLPLHLRDLVPFPQGDNLTDVIINNVHFNGKTLERWNYTLYSNGTLSNESSCWLVFGEYKPFLLLNGTFINGTSCYSPVNSIEERGILGLIFGAFFAVSIVFTLINLRKHGRLFLPREKRWAAVGRRWQWYWMLFLAACGIISAISGIDVDRDYLQSTALILQSFFYYLMLPALLACVWESVRHWGSWQERQICDADSFVLPQNDVRSRKEFYMPLAFYLLDWLIFFMTIPRSWSTVEKQHSPSQIQTIARPAATDGRFKAGAIIACLAWCVIFYNLQHNLYYYKPRNTSPVPLIIAFWKHAPGKLILSISLATIRVGYAIVAAWNWNLSPLNMSVSVGWLYGLGYSPAILVIIFCNIYGYIDSNEDRVLISQRAERGRHLDNELGVTSTNMKPSWWSKMPGAIPSSSFNAQDRLRDLASEMGGGDATSEAGERAVEMRPIKTRLNPGGTSVYDAHSADGLGERVCGNDWDKDNGRSSSSSGRASAKEKRRDSPHHVWGSSLLEPTREGQRRGVSATRTIDSEETLRSVQAHPQVVRSMLDI